MNTMLCSRQSLDRLIDTYLGREEVKGNSPKKYGKGNMVFTY